MAILQAVEGAIIKHYAYYIGYITMRDIPNKKFRRLLSDRQGHLNKELVWNRRKTKEETETIKEAIEKLDESLIREAKRLRMEESIDYAMYKIKNNIYSVIL